MSGLWYKSQLKIVCDTSFLLGLIEHKSFEKLIEKFSPLNLYIPESVLRELINLEKSGGKISGKVRLVKMLIDKYKNVFQTMESISDEPDVDVIEISLRYGYIVATLDKYVRRKAFELGLRVLFLKDGEPYIS